MADAAQTIADFGVELVAIAEGFDMANPYGRAMAQMASVFAEQRGDDSRADTGGAAARANGRLGEVSEWRQGGEAARAAAPEAVRAAGGGKTRPADSVDERASAARRRGAGGGQRLMPPR